MSNLVPSGFGCHRDSPDIRDYTASHDDVQRLMRNLEAVNGETNYVDSRPYCPPVDDQGSYRSSSAHACAGLLQYFERRASGQHIEPSRMFIYKTTRRLLNWSGDSGAKLRSTLKAIVRFGVATEAAWPFERSNLDAEPDAYTYCFDKQFESIRYVRLDELGVSGEQTLVYLRAFLAAGFACVLGFPVYSSVGNHADIPFPTHGDSIRGGQAVVAVGLDDRRRIRSDEGALLVRSSWGVNWGEEGYGWLPYQYVRAHLTFDIWTVVRPEWLGSGEFASPDLVG